MSRFTNMAIDALNEKTEEDSLNGWAARAYGVLNLIGEFAANDDVSQIEISDSILKLIAKALAKAPTDVVMEGTLMALEARETANGNQ